MTADNPPSSLWKKLLLSGSLSDLTKELHRHNTKDDISSPHHLLLWACQQPTSDAKMIQCLLDALPPETILIRNEGVLPSILAHYQGAPPSVGQCLLRRQILFQQGLFLTNSDLSFLNWKEESFLEQVALALHNSATAQSVQHIQLVECCLSQASWNLLQTAICVLPPGQLQTLSMKDLHIWQDQNTPPRSATTTTDPPKEDFLQVMTTRHQSTLKVVEVPYFYDALSSSVAHPTMVALTDSCVTLPNLQVLDVRCRPDGTDTGRQQKKKKKITAMETLSGALRNPICRLKSLALSHLSTSEGLLLLEALQTNQSLQFLNLESISISSKNTALLRQALVRTLQHHNTSLEQVVGPRSLVHSSCCPQVQFYLQLNRDYHRRDIGRWSPSLMPHVLAKGTSSVPAKTFYLLQARPDIVQSKQSNQ